MTPQVGVVTHQLGTRSQSRLSWEGKELPPTTWGKRTPQVGVVTHQWGTRC